MINSQNFFWSEMCQHFFETRSQPFDQPCVSEKRLQMPLRLHQIVKDHLATFRGQAKNCERGTVTAPFRVVNSVVQKVLILSEPSHSEQ